MVDHFAGISCKGHSKMPQQDSCMLYTETLQLLLHSRHGMAPCCRAQALPLPLNAS
jgi:hypothetical protein